MEIKINDTGDTRTVELSGRLDTLTAPEFEEPLRQACEQWQNIIIDCASLDYVSSAGLRVLLAGQKVADKYEHALALINVSADVREVFDITGFSRILDIS